MSQNNAAQLPDPEIKMTLLQTEHTENSMSQSIIISPEISSSREIFIGWFVPLSHSHTPLPTLVAVV